MAKKSVNHARKLELGWKVSSLKEMSSFHSTLQNCTHCYASSIIFIVLLLKVYYHLFCFCYHYKYIFESFCVLPFVFFIFTALFSVNLSYGYFQLSYLLLNLHEMIKSSFCIS